MEIELCKVWVGVGVGSGSGKGKGKLGGVGLVPCYERGVGRGGGG